MIRSGASVPEDAIEQARFNDIAVESAARMLLNRYGVVFRDLVALESNIPRWGVLLQMLRRLEDRGEARGGRFVSGFRGEQFALPEVLESLRRAESHKLPADIRIAGADPLNLIGTLVAGERIPALPGRSFVLTSEALESPGSFGRRRDQEWRPKVDAQKRRAPKDESQEASLFRVSLNA